ncbi:MAG: DEAD/DEAH box helicase [Hylemonella sp.]|nr:DEAD/DEAH box helicase [Hylemonella sp.]
MTDAIAAMGEISPVQPLSSNDTTVAVEALSTEVETPEVETTEAAAPEAAVPNGFVQLGLAPELVQAVADLGYTQPTQVQERAIPLALPDEGQEGRFIDLMVSSQTGSGKTAAFLLPVLHTLVKQQAAADAKERADYEQACAEAAAKGEPAPKRNKRKDPTNPRNFKAPVPGALVVCPTRELAQQVAHDAIELVKHCRGLRIANVVGGMPYQIQIAKLQNANLVVATPGRLLDLQRSMQIKLDQVQFLVVDEADRMLDLGFSDDLAEINQLTAQRRQTMMFSATFAPRIQQLAMRVMHDNGSGVKKIQIDNPQEKHANIKQVLFWADHAQHKRQLLDHWLRDATIDQAIVFASTQVECDGLANDLQQEGFSAVALHGALSQGLRNRRLMALRSGQVQILVATDVAARGIDVPTITHVFNFGLPMKAEDYTHRIGRTGRAGRDGLAVTFAEFRDRRKIFDIEAYSKQTFKAETIPGMEPKQRFPDGRPNSNFGGRNTRGGNGEGYSRDRKFGAGAGRGGFGGGNSRGGDFGQSRGFGDRNANTNARGPRPAEGGFGKPPRREGGYASAGREGGYSNGGREGGYASAGREGFAPRQDRGGEGRPAFGGKPSYAKPGHGGGKPFVARDGGKRAPRPAR